MYLFVDAGNTRIKYAGHDGQMDADWRFHAAVPSDVAADLSVPAGFTPQRIVIVSVAGADVNAHLAQHLAQWSVPIDWFASTDACAGLRNDYANPLQLGADRWAAAIGAWQRVQGACLVVGAGTATTIDLITAEGIFAGGCILPGLDMMQRALAAGTAALPLSAGRFENIPRNTSDAIFSGCLNAQLGAIRRMQERLPDNAPVMLAGGAGEALRDGIVGTVERVPLLVLEGLCRASLAAGSPD